MERYKFFSEQKYHLLCYNDKDGSIFRKSFDSEDELKTSANNHNNPKYRGICHAIEFKTKEDLDEAYKALHGLDLGPAPSSEAIRKSKENWNKAKQKGKILY